jgi:uncharacterized membrane protein YfcA
MFELPTLLTIIAVFTLAGSVKGVIGLGLPTVSLAILTVAIDLPTAMALLLVPSIVTNVWQASSGGNGKEVIKRAWLFLLMATVTVWFGASALTRVDLQYLSALLGGLLIAYAVVNLVGLKFSINKRHEIWLGPVFGVMNGIFTGMTGSFVVPGVMYLQAIGLHRDALIQAMGMLFALSTVALGVALQGNNLLSINNGILSALALLPAMAGMIIGKKIRKKLSEQTFRRVFFVSILILGLYIVANALN